MTGTSKPHCAYCDSDGPLTKDHAWSSAFLDKVGRDGAHFSQKSGRVHGSDYVVRDVCESCNNSRLSVLDQHLCRLYDDYFAEPRDFNTTLTFHYDFDLLARTLLKVAYTSARVAGTDAAPLSRVRDYILGVASRPRQLAVYLEIVSPTLVQPEEAGAANKVFPMMYRSAVTRLLTPNGSSVHTRIVAVNSFYFHLMLPVETLSDQVFDEAALELPAFIEGVVRLDPSKSSTIVSSSPQDGISSIAPLIQANIEQYREYFARKRGDTGGSSAT